MPPNAYQGQYIIEIANQLIKQHQGRFHHTQESIENLLPKDIDPEKDKDEWIDACVEVAQKILGEEDFDIVFRAALDSILSDIKEDLEEFGVIYDEWFCESTLVKKGLIKKGMTLLAKHDYVYEKDGAQWFRATKLGDEKDRVLIRSNGQPTYFASDVAYHLHKYHQDYDEIINIFGSDHHGYINRIRAFLKGLGEDPNKLQILLVQFAILYRGKEKISMSTRKGSFVTLRALRHEVGNDAARFFYIMRKPEQHLDFDLELAKKHSSDNPVYYIQYAHARICSVFRQLKEQSLDWNVATGLAHLAQLNNAYEKELIKQLSRYPELVERAARQREPHLIAHYLLEIANAFHTYYNASKFIVKQEDLRQARLCLIAATQQVLVNALTLLGVSAPEQM